MIVCDELQMKQFGASLIAVIHKPIVIALQGDLGTGKTTLVRGALQASGISSGVRSPTYTLVEYYTPQNLPFAIAHFDLYRLSDPEELEYLGFRDYLDGSTLCLIEWPERGGDLLQQSDLLVKIDYLQQGRNLQLLPQTETAEQVVDSLNLN